jgi:hypothetical protein
LDEISLLFERCSSFKSRQSAIRNSLKEIVQPKMKRSLKKLYKFQFWQKQLLVIIDNPVYDIATQADGALKAANAD